MSIQNLLSGLPIIRITRSPINEDPDNRDWKWVPVNRTVRITRTVCNCWRKLGKNRDSRISIPNAFLHNASKIRGHSNNSVTFLGRGGIEIVSRELFKCFVINFNVSEGKMRLKTLSFLLHFKVFENNYLKLKCHSGGRGNKKLTKVSGIV